MAKPPDQPPLFASDAEIGAALLGPARAKDFAAIAPLLESSGLPKIHPLLGGRYWPAVKAWCDAQHGLSDQVPSAPSGKVDAGSWNAKRRRA